MGFRFVQRGNKALLYVRILVRIVNLQGFERAQQCSLVYSLRYISKSCATRGCAQLSDQVSPLHLSKRCQYLAITLTH